MTTRKKKAPKMDLLQQARNDIAYFLLDSNLDLIPRNYLKIQKEDSQKSADKYWVWVEIALNEQVREPRIKDALEGMLRKRLIEMRDLEPAKNASVSEEPPYQRPSPTEGMKFDYEYAIRSILDRHADEIVKEIDSIPISHLVLGDREKVRLKPLAGLIYVHLNDENDILSFGITGVLGVEEKK